jgi:SAM-dependent methyltransferase
MNDIQTNRVGEIWKEILPVGWGLYEHEEIFFPRLADIANSSEKILEVGIGRGRMVKLLKDSVVNGTRFYGVDLNRHGEVTDAFLTIADTRRLPFPDDTFDLTYSLGVVEHMPEEETARAVREHVRVTRRGGFILITTPARSVLFTPMRLLVYFIKFRKLGTFAEVLGRNLYVREILNTLLDEGCVSLDSGYSGVYLPKMPARIHRAAARLANPRHGAYLWILAQKR